MFALLTFCKWRTPGGAYRVIGSLPLLYITASRFRKRFHSGSVVIRFWTSLIASLTIRFPPSYYIVIPLLYSFVLFGYAVEDAVDRYFLILCHHALADPAVRRFSYDHGRQLETAEPPERLILLPEIRLNQ